MFAFRLPIVILLSIAVTLGFFQNCTQAVPFGNTDYYSELVNSTTFPYEVGFDQVAYLSCSEQEDVFNDGTFFTFRVGAYDSMGLRVNQEFRDSIKKVDDEEVPFALQQSQTSAGAQVQLGIRTLDNLQLMYVDEENGNDGLEGSDYAHFFPAMGDAAFTNMLWYMEPGDYVRYWAGAQFIDEYRFEGELQFMKSSVMENNLRSFLGSRGVLALTFAEPGTITPLGPGSFSGLKNDSGVLSNNIQKNVYGMAVQPRFKQPMFMKRTAGTTGSSGNNHFTEVNPGSDLPPRVLSSSSEVKIDGRSSVANPRSWSCPSEMNFMVVLPRDASAEVPVRRPNGTVIMDGDEPTMHTVTRCAMRSDPVNPSAELKRIRQSFFAEDWYVDLKRKCIVPKPDHVEAGSCYGLNTNDETVSINYDTYDRLGCGNNNPEGVCPHYASICFRQ